MSTWNYRLCKKALNSDVRYAVHTVYYNDAGDITASSVDPADILSCYDMDGEDGEYDEKYVKDWISKELDKVKEALDKPILDLDTITYSEKW